MQLCVFLWAFTLCVFISIDGVALPAGDAFYRVESAQGRDLAVLAAAVYKRATGRLRVLDAMSGSGVRGARYSPWRQRLCRCIARLTMCADRPSLDP